MNFRPREQQGLDIDLTSMIDVVFLLLIFFMVTTTFDKNSAIKIELPTASNADDTGQPVRNVCLPVGIIAPGDDCAVIFERQAVAVTGSNRNHII